MPATISDEERAARKRAIDRARANVRLEGTILPPEIEEINRGHSALYPRTPRLAEELRILHDDGGFSRWLAAVARTDVLLLDDWGLAALDGPTRSDLLEVIDDRAGTRATIITRQLPVEHWHAWIGDATIADALLDRLLSRSHRLVLKGQSLRQRKAVGAVAPDDTAGDSPGANDEPL